MLYNDPWLSELQFEIYPYLMNNEGGEIQSESQNLVENLISLDSSGQTFVPNHVDFDDMSLDSDDSHSNNQNQKQGKKQKKRKLNPDAVLIAQATECTLKSLNLDPNSSEGKKKKRQIRNRMSAQFHRDRKNQYIRKLEEEIARKSEEIAKYKEKVTSLISENSILKSKLAGGSCHIPVSIPMINMIGNDGRVSPKTSTDNESDSASLSQVNHYSSPNYSPFNATGSDEDSTMTLPSRPAVSITQTNGLLNPFNYQTSSRGIGLGLVNRSVTIVSALCMVAICFLGPAQNIQNSSISIPSRRLDAITDFPPSETSVTSRRLSVSDEVGDLNIPARVEAIPSHKKDSHRISSARSTSDLFLGSVSNGSHHMPVKTTGKKKSRHLRAEGIEPFNRSYLSSLDQINRTELSYSSETSTPKSLAMLMRPHNSLSKYDHPSGILDPLFGWPLNAFDYSVLSYSSVVMKEGNVLLDPALALRKTYSFSQRTDASNSISAEKVPLPYKPLAAPPLASLPAPIYNGKQKLQSGEKSSDAGLAVTKKLISLEGKPFWPSGENLEEEPSQQQQAHPHQQQPRQQQSYLTQLMSELNLVTIRLPASAVKVGKSWLDSEDGTVESIMSVLNLTDEESNGGNNGSNNGTAKNGSSYAVSHTSLEINCIILGAKLIHHATSTATAV